MTASVALVTGAGAGIGAAVAKRLGEDGAAVALADIDANAVSAVARSIEQAGGRALARQVDVSDEYAVAKWVEEAADALGRPGHAVACAGVAAIGTVTHMPLETFDHMMAVNVRGVFLLARAAMPYLADGGGTFTAIASDAAINGFQGYAAYCTSKHAVAGLIKCLALDHGPAGVRSNAICPGYVETAMLDKLLSQMSTSHTEAEKAVPLGRLARPGDVANLVAFLASEQGGYINGALLPLDGGGTAGPYVPDGD